MDEARQKGVHPAPRAHAAAIRGLTLRPHAPAVFAMHEPPKSQPKSQPAKPGPGPSAATAWVLLDWAASGFSTVLITLIVTYVERVAFAEGAWGMPAGVVWAWTLAAAMLAAGMIAPFLSALADRTDGHQRALIASVIAGAGGLFVLAATPPGLRVGVVAAIILANVGFDMAAIFTGSLLPRIAGGAAADRLSARGFAAGYAGGAVALVVATLLATGHARLGLSAAGGLRAGFLFTGCWWLLFSLPAAVARFGSARSATHAATSAGELLAFAASLVRTTPTDGTRPLAAVLAGAVLVLGAVQTAIAQFSSVALAEFQLAGPALVRLVLLVQLVALPGALLIGSLAARVSRRWATGVCLAGWIAVLLLAGWVRTVAQLHALAVLLALVLGGIQSVLRAAVADAAPEGRAGATFGLLQVGTKLAGAAASLGFGAAYQLSGSPRSGLVLLAAQMALGWWALRRCGDPSSHSACHRVR
jgi:UMF1 family MFS transporter